MSCCVPSCHYKMPRMCDVTHHLHVWHDASICVTWRIHLCGMTHSRMRSASFIHMTRCIHMLLLQRKRVRGAVNRAFNLMCHVCVTHSYTWRDVLMFWFCGGRVWGAVLRAINWICYVCVTLHIQMCNMTHSYVWHDTFTNAKWFVHTCDVMHSHVGAAEGVCESLCFELSI